MFSARCLLLISLLVVITAVLAGVLEDVSYRHRRATNQKAAAPKASGGKSKNAAKGSKTGGNSATAAKAQKAGHGSALKSVGDHAKTNVQAGVIGKMQKAATVAPKPPNCAGANVEALIKCCATPISDFFPTSMLMACNKQRNNGGLFRNIGLFQLNRWQNFRKSNQLNMSDVSIVERFAQEACVTKCVFTDFGFWNSATEVVDQTSLTSFFSFSSAAPWKPIISKAVSDCATLTTSLKTKGIFTLKTKVEQCSVYPYVFMQCVRLSMALSCPDIPLLTSQCNSTLVTLKACDTFNAMLFAAGITTTTSAVSTTTAVTTTVATTTTTPTTTTVTTTTTTPTSTTTATTTTASTSTSTSTSTTTVPTTVAGK